MSLESTVPPLATAFGGGGLFGIAYLLGIGEALVDGGVSLGDTPSLGTSAGSWASVAFATNTRWATAIDLLGDIIPRRPDPRPGRLRRVAAELFGDRYVPTMRAVACSLPRLRRTVLDGRSWPAADLIAASSAVPAVLAPHRVGRHWYVDGGVRSLVSADLAASAGHLLVVAPIAGPMLGPAGRLAERVLQREVNTWKTTNPGGKMSLIRPNHAIADLARWPNHLFDPDRAQQCYELAYIQGTHILTAWRDQPSDEVSNGSITWTR